MKRDSEFIKARAKLQAESAELPLLTVVLLFREAEEVENIEMDDRLYTGGYRSPDFY